MSAFADLEVENDRQNVMIPKTKRVQLPFHYFLANSSYTPSFHGNCILKIILLYTPYILPAEQQHTVFYSNFLVLFKSDFSLSFRYFKDILWLLFIFYYFNFVF